jgi:photosystem II stability/assembly factor-like uncharacterized protein
VSKDLPVIHQSLSMAARSRIGYRGLYTTSLVRLEDGTLLVCPHYGSVELNKVSIWRSEDEGITWKEVQIQGDELFGSGALLHYLQNGTVLLHTGALYRSDDSGITWKKISCTDVGIIRSIVKKTDGTLMLFGSEASWYSGYEPPPRTLIGIAPQWYREGAQGAVAMSTAWRICSKDNGLTWSEPEWIINERVRVTDNTDWPRLQPFFREACIIGITDSHLLAATRRSYPHEHMVLTESYDGGMTWTEPRQFLGAGEIHAHLLPLKDGRILCTYARQELPRGIFAIISTDQGKTWDTAHPIYLGRTLSNFFGWPTSIEMPDGTLLTSYTIKGYEETTQVNDSATEVVRWSDKGAEIQPCSKPVFLEKHDYSKYTQGVTGFVGAGLQRVERWELHSAERFQLPGYYKGALSRFNDGHLLVCPVLEDETYSVIYRSTDDGVSWHKVQTRGDKIPNKEQAMLCLSDNKTVLLQTEAPGNPLFRSVDRGVTWQRIHYGEPTGTTRNFIEQSDGTILIFGSKGDWRHEGTNTTAWRLSSRDKGLTWERHQVSAWDSSAPFFGEASFLPFSDTHFLAAVRVSGKFARTFVGASPMDIGILGEVDECMVLMESEDAGLTWSHPRLMPLGYSTVHAYPIKLSDGRILCTYRRRFLPFGIGAVISYDNGKTWDTQESFILGICPTSYGGWQTSVELPDGVILTTWAYMTWPGATFEAIRWRLP